ncbi:MULTISPECIES: ABC transporter permease [unclassified Meridianimarinicoccus]|uniref:ABC transporter permease n=1 Tax=unclassified Meridianimarinicoccus TaxID=2923344 RepID=UPI00186726A9|nr:ABC transporter permease [Fluviibacterium sp. MJW13]
MTGGRAGLLALLSHWRRHPGQALTLLLGLALATALWTGVQAINAEARASYDRAASMLDQQGRPVWTRSDGAPVRLDTYVTLRKAGYPLAPVIEGTTRIGGQTVTLLGLDPLSAPILPEADAQNTDGTDGLAAFIGPPGQFFGAPETLARLDQTVAQALVPASDLAPGLLVGDIGTVSRLLDQPDTLSRMIEVTALPAHLPPLTDLAPQLTRSQPDRRAEIAGLTGAFHLNLTAFGFLSFTVGLFIAHGAVGLAFEQRRAMMRTLRALGLPARTLIALMAAELVLFALVAGTLGVLLGYLIAAALLPDVAATLRGLYGAPATGTLSLRPGWIGAGFAMAGLGTTIAAAQSLTRLLRLPILASAQPRAWRLASTRNLRRQAGAAIGLIALSGTLAWLGDGLATGFVLLGALLLGAALLLPPLLAAALARAVKAARRPLPQWFWADSRQQLPGLSLALMALLLALAANIGVSTMVGSFRLAFTDWLDQRLVAEVYVDTGTPEMAMRLRPVLDSAAREVLPRVFHDTRINNHPGAVQALSPAASWRQTWPLLDATPDAWEGLAAGTGAFINEQLHYRQTLALGDEVRIDDTAYTVLGIYPDYGNPSAEALIGLKAFQQQFPEVPIIRFALRMPPGDVAAFSARLRSEYGLPAAQIIDQSALKASGHAVFERTFAITRALNLLTLGVAALAMLTSLLTLSTQRLPQVAPVWALGLQRRHIGALELLRSALLAAMTAVLAIPVGLCLAWVLLAVVNVGAFGWRLPMTVFPGDWIRLTALAILAALAAAALPARKLASQPPVVLMKGFFSDR